MDPDACRNCGHSGKHTTFLDHRCAIHERDDAERDKLQADAALERARSLCETSLTLMKRQMQELEDANEAIEALAAALAAAEDRRERVRRDLGAHGDVCLTARSNLEAAEEMAIAAAGRYFEAGRAVSALEEREALEAKSSEPRWEREQPQEDGEGEEEEGDARRWQRSNERFCKWLRQSEAQRQIMKSSWTKLRVAERLAGEGAEVDEEQVARERRVQEWAAARRSDLPPDEDPTLVTEEGADCDGGGAADACGDEVRGREAGCCTGAVEDARPEREDCRCCCAGDCTAVADEDDDHDDGEGAADGEEGGEPDKAYDGDEGEEGSGDSESEGCGDEGDEGGEDREDRGAGYGSGGSARGERRELRGAFGVGEAAESYEEEEQGAAVPDAGGAAEMEVDEYWWLQL
ncbi:hypothetical protein COL922a_008860 [Colletotrichum nupharicola]|nr:hypothetical protein COL922a_008860 [Colletotrichum nupharicola]